MDRFFAAPGLPRRGDGEIARALGIDQRRASYGKRAPQRRNSMEPVVPNMAELWSERETAMRRQSLPVGMVPAGSAPNEYLAASSWHNATNALRPINANVVNATAGANATSLETVMGSDVKQQWTLVDVVSIPGLREDFYSTLVASSCPLYPGESDDWAFLYGYPLDASDEELLSLNKLGEILLAASWYACRWTPQLGPQLFRHHIHANITSVAVTRLGFCIIGDEEGYIRLYDMVQDPPPLLARGRLSDIVAATRATESPTAGARHYATHMLWSEKTPALDADGTVISRCGYRIEFFVGSNQGIVYKLAVSSNYTFAVDAATPAHQRHCEGVSAMALDYNQDILAVAGVDSEVTIWTHLTACGSANSLALRYRFNQFSAVKGMAFCPGQDSLLALGGGRKDRALRIYNTEDHKLVRQVPMPAQIVGVVWLSRWEVFVALGHSRLKHYSGLGKVYNLATGRVVCSIPGSGYALSAIKSRRGVSIYTNERALMEFSWTPQTSPQTSAAVLATLKMSYPPAPFR